MLQSLLNDGWDYHDKESARLAGELEAAAGGPIEEAQLVPFLKLASHTIGEHLADWPRARRLAERVLESRAPTTATAKAWTQLSIARLLAGDAAGSVAAELTGLRASVEDFRPALVEARFMLVAALVGSGRAAEASPIYAGALALARRLGEAAPDRAIAVASNNLASELVEAPVRTDEADALMRKAAEAAHEFWRRCGTWVNEERALYLKAQVANALGEPAEALVQADAALKLIAENGEEPVDAVFLHLAKCRSLRLSGDPTSADELAAADEAAAAWDDQGLKAWYAEERARAIG